MEAEDQQVDSDVPDKRREQARLTPFAAKMNLVIANLRSVLSDQEKASKAGRC